MHKLGYQVFIDRRSSQANLAHNQIRSSRWLGTPNIPAVRFAHTHTYIYMMCDDQLMDMPKSPEGRSGVAITTARIPAGGYIA